MPIPVGAIIMGAQILAPIAASLLNRRAQKKQNEEDREFTREMYEKQYQDNLALWNIQNEYNEPKKQMERFAEGGLNPHLIYGRSNESGPIKSPEAKQFNQPAPRIDGDLMAGYAQVQNVKQIQAQTDNLHQLNELYEADRLLKLIKAEGDTIDLDVKAQLKDTVVEMSKQQLEKTKADTKYTIDQNLRNELKLSSDLALQATQQALTATQSRLLNEQLTSLIRKAVSEAEYAEIEAALAKKGFMRGDTYDVRVLAEVGTALGAGTKVAEIIKLIMAMSK